MNFTSSQIISETLSNINTPSFQITLPKVFVLAVGWTSMRSGKADLENFLDFLQPKFNANEAFNHDNGVSSNNVL